MRTPAPTFQAVVIGTSAGGVEALSAVLPGLPRDLGAAILIVVHLPRERRSLLAEIFSARCALPVMEATDKEPLVPGSVYFAPPDYHLLVEAGPAVALSRDEPVQFSRPSIDVLFESAADVFGPLLTGVLLTGANSDGAAGLEAISQRGGRTVVQDPRGAYAPYMPQSALDRFTPTHVAPLSELAALLTRLISVPPQGIPDV